MPLQANRRLFSENRDLEMIISPLSIFSLLPHSPLCMPVLKLDFCLLHVAPFLSPSFFFSRS